MCTKRGGEVRPVAVARGGGRREARRLEWRLAVEVVHGPRPVQRARTATVSVCCSCPRREAATHEWNTTKWPPRLRWWPPPRGRSVIMSPCSRPWGVARTDRTLASAARSRPKRGRVVGPLTGEQPQRVVVVSAVEGREVESHPFGHGRPCAESGSWVRSSRALHSRATPAPAVPAVRMASPSWARLGVAVVVEEQVQSRRRPQVEQRPAARSRRSDVEMWQRPGRSVVQRPTSLVCVVRVAMRSIRNEVEEDAA